MTTSQYSDLDLNRKEPKTVELRVLEGMASDLFEIRTLLERMLSAERTGAVSSVTVKFTAATKDVASRPSPEVHEYAGSVAPVEEAVEAYGRAVLLMERAQTEGWEQTVSMLKAKRENGHD